MANRNYNRFQALTKEAKALFAEVSIAAAGAPTLVRKNAQGVSSVARNSAGNYTITLDDKYNDLLQLSHSVQLAAGAPSSVAMILRSEAVDSTKQIVVQFVDAAGAAVELDDTTVVRFEITLKNSSV